MREVDFFSVGRQGKFTVAVFAIEFFKVISVSIKCCCVFYRDKSGVDLSDFCPSLAPSMLRQEMEYCLFCYQLLFFQIRRSHPILPRILGSWQLRIVHKRNLKWSRGLLGGKISNVCLSNSLSPFFFFFWISTLIINNINRSIVSQHPQLQDKHRGVYPHQH